MLLQINKNMYTLNNTSDNSKISKHRSLTDAIAAQNWHAKKLMLKEGVNARVTYSIVDDKGKAPTDADLVNAQLKVWMKKR
jgi:hypothetical protein